MEIRTLLGILVGIIIILVGLIINIVSSLNTESYWIGIGLFFGGIGVVVLFVMGRKKS